MGLLFGGNLSARGDRVQSVRHELAGGNRTLRIRHPQAVYPNVPVLNCETFSDCMGDDMDDWGRRGTCCARFLGSDWSLRSTYCGAYVGGDYYNLFENICPSMRRYFTTDTAFGTFYQVPTDILNQWTSACNAWCTETDNDNGWCTAREYDTCFEAAGVSQTAKMTCRATFPNASSYRYSVPVFDYGGDCFGLNAAGKFEYAAICSTWCDKTGRAGQSVNPGGSGSSDFTYHEYCTWPEKIRNCVTGGTDFYECCVKAELQGALAGACTRFNPGGQCQWDLSDTRTPLPAVCNPYCSKYSGSDRPSWCKLSDFVGCLAESKSDDEIKGKCCAKSYWSSYSSPNCSYSQFDFTQESLSPSYEIPAGHIAGLCSNLRSKSVENPWSPCGLEISRDRLNEVCNAFCSNVPEDETPLWCVQGDEDKYQACREGKEVNEMTPTPRPGYEPLDVAYDDIQRVFSLIGAPVDVTAKCCGENPKADSCSQPIERCKAFFDPKYESKRDEIEDGDYGDDDQESLERVVRFCNKLCGSFDDEPDWCDNIPANDLLAGEIAAIVLGCFLFVAIVGIVVLVILYVKKPGVGGAA